MAVDEALMDSAAQQGTATLRFYAWSPATLSLGYFQRRGDRIRHVCSAGLPMVRRPSGGGAIVHHHELTYSFTGPLTDRFSDAESLVQSFHETLADVLRHWNVLASLRPTTAATSASGAESTPFLCFQRRARLDLLVDQQKICGSAQRRHKSAGLLHGSILLRRSEATPELPGIAELSRRIIEPADLRRRWSEQLADRLNWRLVPSELTPDETLGTATLQQQRFERLSWNHRR